MAHGSIRPAEKVAEFEETVEGCTQKADEQTKQRRRHFKSDGGGERRYNKIKQKKPHIILLTR